MTDWKPIETAPKDGTAIDLWVVRLEYGTAETFDGQRHADVCWGQVRGNGYEQGEAWVKYQYGSWDDIAPEPEFRATHWVPLPQPPEH